MIKEKNFLYQRKPWNLVNTHTQSRISFCVISKQSQKTGSGRWKGLKRSFRIDDLTPSSAVNPKCYQSLDLKVLDIPLPFSIPIQACQFFFQNLSFALFFLTILTSCLDLLIHSFIHSSFTKCLLPAAHRARPSSSLSWSSWNSVELLSAHLDHQTENFSKGFAFPDHSSIWHTAL